MPVSFSTQRNAGMCSFEPSRIPDWLAPVCEERSVSHSVEPVRTVFDPSRHHRSVAVAQRATEHREREAVDLQEQDPRDVRRDPVLRAACDALDDPEGVSVVVVRPEDRVEDDGHSGSDERGDERPAERVDPDRVRGDLGRYPQHDRVEDEHDQEARDQREREAQGGDDRRQDGVQERDQRRGDDGAEEAVDADLRHDLSRDEQRRRGDEPSEDQAKRAQARHFGLPGRPLAVLRVDVVHECGNVEEDARFASRDQPSSSDSPGARTWMATVGASSAASRANSSAGARKASGLARRMTIAE